VYVVSLRVNTDRLVDRTLRARLFATYRHHTNSTLGMVEADQRHRDHAIASLRIFII
jgi:hypothetical protein